VDGRYIYHSESSGAFTGYSNWGLPVVWQPNEKALITASLFESYFASELFYELKTVRDLQWRGEERTPTELHVGGERDAKIHTNCIHDPCTKCKCEMERSRLSI
jgi:hypothetical protein